MNNKNHLDHEIEESISRMSQTQKATLYFELLFRLMWYRLRRRVYFARPRARTHWMGRANRPRRLERPLLFMVIVVAPLVLEIDEYLLWLALWSGGAAFFINFSAALRRVPQKRHHWIR